MIQSLRMIVSLDIVQKQPTSTRYHAGKRDDIHLLGTFCATYLKSFWMYRYFLWDMVTAIRYIKHQGVGMAFHGVAAFAVFILSFVSASWQLYSRTKMFSAHQKCWHFSSSAHSSTITELSLSCMNLARPSSTSIGSWISLAGPAVRSSCWTALCWFPPSLVLV